LRIGGQPSNRGCPDRLDQFFAVRDGVSELKRCQWPKKSIKPADFPRRLKCYSVEALKPVPIWKFYCPSITRAIIMRVYGPRAAEFAFAVLCPERLYHFDER
jgi:hypothetical protein